MTKQNNNMEKDNLQNEDTQQPVEEPVTNAPETEEPAASDNEQPATEDQLDALRREADELRDKNLRMMAEFDNYRRRTNKEKLELISTAGERIFREMLPLVDDFERAREAMLKTDVINSLREGIDLIYNKFISFLDKQDVHVIPTEGADFSTDEHEAVTTFPAGEDKKGKVIDCTQKGYKLADKVIRYAKVVVGE